MTTTKTKAVQKLAAQAKFQTSRVMLVNNTDARITSTMHTLLCAFAMKDQPLDPAYFDAFNIYKFDVAVPEGVAYPTGCTTQTRVVIFWKGEGPTKRALWVLQNYKLEFIAGSWRASVKGCEWSEHRVIEGADRAAVVHEFRCRWGHFNHQDEADAFGQIFREIA